MAAQLMDFSDPVVLVTGGSTGHRTSLWKAASHGEASDGDRRCLDELKLTLDQLPGLLRRRRAVEEFDLDAAAARVRPPEVVERYER